MRCVSVLQEKFKQQLIELKSAYPALRLTALDRELATLALAKDPISASTAPFLFFRLNNHLSLSVCAATFRQLLTDAPDITWAIQRMQVKHLFLVSHSFDLSFAELTAGVCVCVCVCVCDVMCCVG